jgi:outer membrane protein insertion porin family
MKASALLILLLFPSLALAQQQYYGTKAVSVLLPLPADPIDARLLAIQSGDSITPDNIRASIQALYNTGRYRTVSVDASPIDGGTQVSFIVTAQYYFSTIRLEPANLLDRPITSYFPPPYGKKFSTAPVERFIADTIKLLEEVGYFNVTINPEYSPDETTRLMTVILKADALDAPAKIRGVAINGAQKLLSDKDLRGALKVSDGDDFNQDKIDKGVSRTRQKFVDSGYLTAKVRADRTYDSATNRVDLDIQIDPGKTTIVQVTEEGSKNSQISEKTLRTLVPIFEEGAVDSELMNEGRDNIVGYYQQLGFFDASATAQVTEGADQSVRVDYVVTKREEHRVRSIRILGSAFFTEADILKKMKTSEGKLSSHGLFSPELLQADVRMIETMYRKAGFQSTEVHSADEQSADHDIDITIEIHEGLRSTLDEITFTGNKSFTEPVLWHEAGIQADQIYSTAIIDNARDALAAMYYSQGYSEAHIETHLEFNSYSNTVNVQFDITEGARYQIGWIVVSGNAHTAEKVITRSSGLHPDDPYSPEGLLEAQQKLYSLGLFNRVEIATIDQDLGVYKNLLIQVEEAKTIVVTPGLGVSEAGRFRGTLELSDNNLFGQNRTLAARLRVGYRERQFQTSYREPRLFNHDIQGIAALTLDKTDHLSHGDLVYQSNEVNVSLQTVRKLSKTRTLSLLASYETVNLLGPLVVIKTPGLIQIARLGSSVITDRRDSIRDPTRGNFITTSVEVADKHWGSEVNFVSLFNQSSYYTPVRGGVLATSARVGWKPPYGGDTELPISERFFAGGSTTLRGFKQNEAGPLGGGQLMTIGNIEYRFPVKFTRLKNLRGGIFYDTGNVFERPSDFALTDFTNSVGAGLRYITPIGPIRLDVGFNLHPKPKILDPVTQDVLKPADRKFAVLFTLGHAF